MLTPYALIFFFINGALLMSQIMVSLKGESTEI